jgi:hypothetical protein
MKKVLHQPYSLDLAFSDFFLFANVKRLLSRCTFAMIDKHFWAIKEILNGIEKTI